MDKEDTEHFINEALAAGLFLNERDKKIILKYFDLHQKIVDSISKNGEELTPEMDDMVTKMMEDGFPEGWRIVQNVNNLMSRNKPNE